MSHAVRFLACASLFALVAVLNAHGADLPAWYAYTYHAGTFTPLPGFSDRLISDVIKPPVDFSTNQPSDRQFCNLDRLPTGWHVVNALRADLDRDVTVECALLVWRPWQDWPIMRWSDTDSPIAAHLDARGDSSHIILLQPLPDSSRQGIYRELWAGSALAVPIIQIRAGDVDGDGWDELVALEGDYATGRLGPAIQVAVWRWNGFGFTLDWRSPANTYTALALSDINDDGQVEILVR